MCQILPSVDTHPEWQSLKTYLSLVSNGDNHFPMRPHTLLLVILLHHNITGLTSKTTKETNFHKAFHNFHCRSWLLPSRNTDVQNHSALQTKYKGVISAPISHNLLSFWKFLTSSDFPKLTQSSAPVFLQNLGQYILVNRHFQLWI
jgi:hypothetical protein